MQQNRYFIYRDENVFLNFMLDSFNIDSIFSSKKRIKFQSNRPC